MIVCRDCKYLWGELKKLQKENRELEAALAEKPDVVRCVECEHYEPEVEVTSIDPLSPPDYEPPLCKWFNFPTNKNDFCSFGRKEAKDED